MKIAVVEGTRLQKVVLLDMNPDRVAAFRNAIR